VKIVRTEFEDKFWKFVDATNLQLRDKLSIGKGDGFELLMKSIDDGMLDGKELASKLSFSFETHEIVAILLELSKLRRFKASMELIGELDVAIQEKV
jgi:hypothetical protein